jgi:hypothetical protein
MAQTEACDERPVGVCIAAIAVFDEEDDVGQGIEQQLEFLRRNALRWA